MRILLLANHARFAAVAVSSFLSAHEVVVAPSIAAARESLHNGHFDVALVDYDLDDGKGAEIVSEIRHRPFAPVIIAVSSHDAGNDAILMAGADDVCEKLRFNTIEEVMQRVKQGKESPPCSAQELLKRYEAGERIFYDVELDTPDRVGDYPNFEGARLDDIVFRFGFLYSNFRGASLRNARLHSNLKCCNFTNADLRGASLRGCALEAAQFDGAILDGADFTGATVYGHTLSKGELP